MSPAPLLLETSALPAVTPRAIGLVLGVAGVAVVTSGLVFGWEKVGYTLGAGVLGVIFYLAAAANEQGRKGL